MSWRRASATAIITAGLGVSVAVSPSNSFSQSLLAPAFKPANAWLEPRATVAQSAAAQAPTAKRSVWDGVYTDAQARRGEGQYGRSCEQCHGTDLSGNQVDEVPSLVWDAFMAQWSGKTARDLFEQVSRSMPRDAPGSLSARAYADVIAYILQANKLPSGNQELDRNPDRLEQIVIERSRK